MVRSFPGVVERLADGLQLLRIEGRTFAEFPGFHGLPLRSTLILPLGAQNTMATLVRKSPQFGWASFALSAWHGTPGYQLLITVRNRAFIRWRTLVPSPWDTEGMLVLTCAV